MVKRGRGKSIEVFKDMDKVTHRKLERKIIIYK